ncbi:MAG: LamG-like jellyroll fold domain-containing protein, partial [Bacteroidota bacterium]
VTNDTAEEIEVTVTADGTDLEDTPSIVFQAGGVSASNSSVSVSSPVTVGDNSTVTITLEDANENPISGLSAEDFSLALTGEASEVAESFSADGNEYTFEVTNDTAEEIEVTVTADGTDLEDTPSIVFQAGGVDHFVLLTTDGDPIGDQVAGEAFEVQVQAIDELGNVVPDYDGEKTIQFSGADTAPDGESDPDYPEKVTFKDGVASPVEITLYLAETDLELTIEEGSVSGTSDAFDVLANEVLTMRLSGPESLVAGEVSDVFTITILDAYENRAPVSEDTEFDLTSTGTVFYQDAVGENESTTHTIADGGGAGDFYYSTNESGDHTITATWSSGEPLLDGQSDSFEIQVGAAAPDRLGIVTQPEVDVEGEPLTVQPVLHLLDEHGNRIDTDSSTEVSVDIGEGEDGELGGTTKVTFKEGVGTFDDLVLSGTPGTDYKLRFRTEPNHGMDPVLSDTLSMAAVAAGVPASLEKVSGDDQSQPTRSELEESITVRVLDRDEEPLAGGEIEFSFTDVPDGAVDYEVVDSLLVSDDEGLVRARIRVGSEPGEYTISAAAVEGSPDPVSFGATATFTAPNPTFVDTVNTVVFSGGLSSYMYSEYDESIDQPDGMNFETWVLPNSLESDNGVIAARWEEDNPENQQFRIRVLENEVTLDLFDEQGNRYTLEIPDFFRTGAGSSLVSLSSTKEDGEFQLSDNHEEFSWTHISVGVDPANELIQVYRDGFEVKRTQMFAKMRSTKSRLEVGRGFDGEVHEIRLWSRARSRSEIQAQKDLMLSGTEENLVLYHTFDDTSNTEIAEDSTPNENHFYFGEDVDRKFSLRNVTLVTMHQDEDFIVRLAALNETGGEIRASVIELPKNGTIHQLGEELEVGDPIDTTGEEIVEAFNRSLYKPDSFFAGLDSIRYRITDQYGNYSDSVMKFEVLAVNRPPRVDLIGQAEPGSLTGRLEFDQRDSLQIGLDTLVTDYMYEAEEMDWTIDIVDERRQQICLSMDASSDLQSCANLEEGEEESTEELSGAAAQLQEEQSDTSTSYQDSQEMEIVKSEVDGSVYKAWLLQESGEFLIVQFQADDRELTLTSTDRFHDRDLHLRLEATDPEGLSGRRDFYVTVLQVNDPPTDFSLLQPADQDTIPINQLQFAWEASVDAEEDPIEYTLFLERDDGQQLQVEALSDTLFAFEEYPELLVPDREFTWWVEASDAIEQTESRERWHFVAGDEVPLIYKLRQNYPNPWRSETTIEYWVPVQSRVVIEVYDILGRRVETVVDEESVEPGIYRRLYSNGRLASGVYFYRMVAQGANGSRYLKTQKMTYIR